jgi:hypothetical protein
MMNEKTRAYVNRVAKIVETFPAITKAVVVGIANEKNYTFGDDKIQLAIFTKPEVKYTKVCIDLNNELFDNDLTMVDIYMTADEDFYAEVYNLLDSGEVIFERK